jgi:hypothetical protein
MAEAVMGSERLEHLFLSVQRGVINGTGHSVQDSIHEAAERLMGIRPVNIGGVVIPRRVWEIFQRQRVRR